MESSHKGVSHGDAFIVNVCIFLRLFGGGKNFKVVLWCRRRRVGAGGCLAGVFARGMDERLLSDKINQSISAPPSPHSLFNILSNLSPRAPLAVNKNLSPLSPSL